MFRKVLQVFAKIAFGSARLAIATTSIMGIYQPEEPEFEKENS